MLMSSQPRSSEERPRQSVAPAMYGNGPAQLAREPARPAEARDGARAVAEQTVADQQRPRRRGGIEDAARDREVEIEGLRAVAHRLAARVEVQHRSADDPADRTRQIERPLEGPLHLPPDLLPGHGAIVHVGRVEGGVERHPGGVAGRNRVGVRERVVAQREHRARELLVASHHEVEGERQLVAPDPRVAQVVEDVLEARAAGLERRDRRRQAIAQRAEGGAPAPRGIPADRRGCARPRCSGGRA